MYKPDITFARSNINFYWHKDVGFGVPVACSSTDFDAARFDFSRAIPLVHLEAYNVGLASAKRVKVGWDVDINECIATLAKLDAKNEFRVWNHCCPKRLNPELGDAEGSKG